MNILVTGAAGYVGSICVEVLVERGYKILGLDNLTEGHRHAIPPQAGFWECDLNDRNQLDRVFSSQPIDAVMHFAAEALVEKSVREPSTFYATNVACGINLLDAMIRHGVRKIVFSSTAAVYGEPERVPIPEEHPKAPINPYGRSKANYTGLQHVSLRYFNAAGASKEHGEDHRTETHLIPRLLEVALGKRKHFEVNGNDYATPDGTCVRDYVHVLDIAGAHVLALARIERFSGQAFNVGNERGYSVMEVLDVARRVTRHPLPAVVTARRPGDPAVLVASSEKIRRALRWNPRLSNLAAIVETAWAWRQKYPAGYAAQSEETQSSKPGRQPA